jgi:hypothetical protein
MQNFFGHPDCSKIATTQVMNQDELFLRQNLAAWKALPADQKTPATMFSKKKSAIFSYKQQNQKMPQRTPVFSARSLTWLLM